MTENEKQPKAPKPTALERWRSSEQAYADAVWSVLSADGSPLLKKDHKRLKDLRYAADDRQRKYFKSLRKG